jgi:polyvinyl alcohol dehydrogenase (cytochrome)
VYGTFGQPYTEPASVAACNKAAANGFSESCEQPGSYLKSIVAFDVKSGQPRWSYRVRGHDPWLRACGSQPPSVTWCAQESDDEKWDMGGSGANVMRIRMDGHWRDVVGVGGKSGVYVLLDANTGEFIWNTLIGPGGDQGGMEWGTAFDGERIYASITNHHHIPYKLTEDGVLSNTTVTGGSWAALDPVTGKILWQTADPQVETLSGLGTVGVWDLAPVTVANGIVYASSMAKRSTRRRERSCGNLAPAVRSIPALRLRMALSTGDPAIQDPASKAPGTANCTRSVLMVNSASFFVANSVVATQSRIF